MIEHAVNELEVTARVTPNLTGEILRFLWRWKVASTAALHQRFMPTLTGPGYYARLRRMMGDGLIQMRATKNPRQVVWTLARKGFQRVRESLPEMKEEGYLSEHLEHDILVTAIHLGDGMFGPIEGLTFITEQELRRLGPHHLPPRIPNCCDRRPDGYWISDTERGRNFIALEVELNAKAPSDYHSMARFYSGAASVDSVIWVTKTPAMAKAIHRMLLAETEGDSKHDFITLENIYRFGWSAKVSLGRDEGKSLYEMLAKTAQNTRKSLFTIYALDLRTTPYISPCKKLFAPDGFSY